MKAPVRTVLALVTLLAGAASAALGTEPITGRASVIEGDTIEIGGTRLRFSLTFLL